MVWRPSSVRPSSFQNASSSSFLNWFWFWLFHKIGLGGGFKTSTQNREFIIYGNLCKFIRNHKKCFFFISRPILIAIDLFGRAELRTLNFYTEFWNFAPLINYGNLCKFIPKIKKNCFFSHISWPIFILFVLSDRARWGLQNLYTKFWNSLIMLIYANLFKITNKITKNASSPSFLNRFWFSLLYLVELSLVH